MVVTPHNTSPRGGSGSLQTILNDGRMFIFVEGFSLLHFVLFSTLYLILQWLFAVPTWLLFMSLALMASCRVLHTALLYNVYVISVLTGNRPVLLS